MKQNYTLEINDLTQIFSIDNESIAKGLYNMWPEDDKIVMAFGMIPKQWEDITKKYLMEKIEEIAEIGEEKDWQYLVTNIYTNIVNVWYAIGCKC